MLDKAGSEFQCGRDDAACLCKNVNFGYGVRDCSAAICSVADAETAVNWAKKWCADAGVTILDVCPRFLSRITSPYPVLTKPHRVPPPVPALVLPP